MDWPWKVLFVIIQLVIPIPSTTLFLTGDPLAYNREVDDTLELDGILKPSRALTELLSCLDRTKVKPWIFTNAYINHAKRVLKLLDIGRFFEGNALQ
jgi:FMN phosphatase YigB (HAD superfamily)